MEINIKPRNIILFYFEVDDLEIFKNFVKSFVSMKPEIIFKIGAASFINTLWDKSYVIVKIIVKNIITIKQGKFLNFGVSSHCITAS